MAAFLSLVVPFRSTAIGSRKSPSCATPVAHRRPGKTAISPAFAAIVAACSGAAFSSRDGRANRNLDPGTIVVLVPRPFWGSLFVLQSGTRGQFSGRIGGPVLPDFRVIRRVASRKGASTSNPQGNARGIGKQPAISSFNPSQRSLGPLSSRRSQNFGRTLYPHYPNYARRRGIVKSLWIVLAWNSRGCGRFRDRTVKRVKCIIYEI